MGLDWVLDNKIVNGREVVPYETLGARHLNKDDPETVEVFRKVWESRQKDIKTSNNDQYVKFWGRPFEAVLSEVEPEHPILPDTYKGEDGKSPCTGIAVSDLDLRGKAVVWYLRSIGEDEIAERCFEKFTPDQMRDFADEIEALQFEGDGKEFMTQTVTWLRFWADKGHGIIPWF